MQSISKIDVRRLLFFLLCQISSQTRNAQLAFLRAHPEASLPKIQHPMKFWGVGAPIHIVRNSVALSGFRLVSGHIREPFEKISNSMGIAVSRSRMNVLCDFTGCLCTLFVTVIKFKVQATNNLMLLNICHVMKVFKI